MFVIPALAIVILTWTGSVALGFGSVIAMLVRDRIMATTFATFACGESVRLGAAIRSDGYANAPTTNVARRLTESEADAVVRAYLACFPFRNVRHARTVFTVTQSDWARVAA